MMIATEFKPIPVAVLCKHEAAVLRGLESLPLLCEKAALEDPEIRIAFLYYSLLTHWPELLGDDFTAEDLIANRLYWSLRFREQYEKEYDFEAGLEQEAFQIMQLAAQELGADSVRDIEKRFLTEVATNEWEIAVAFSNFSIRKVKKQFGISIDETGDFFANVAPISISAELAKALKRSLPLALKINTEKARAEMIVTPILLEVYEQLGEKISLFSGLDWDVDEAQGLRGRCDFLLGLTPEQLVIEAPVLMVVEVKKQDTNAGIGQCLAEMVAAQIFNRQKGNDVSTIYGIVTAGNIWKFLRLVDKTAFVDVTEYHIKEVERIVGIIVSMFTSSGIARNT